MEVHWYHFVLALIAIIAILRLIGLIIIAGLAYAFYHAWSTHAHAEIYVVYALVALTLFGLVSNLGRGSSKDDDFTNAQYQRRQREGRFD
ncbi:MULTISPECIES: hypothetical protein [unclassified Novosphingobium]|uniref:hypothetical protein n=1 Tax=unclassified Novosphingobium TaxID=2644732 RepID=UPI001469EB1A|nr:MULTISPECIES: hypothetical protein [unclassified Novosphingobium]NMN07534.1 flagellar basal body-associated protein FliL [Novosphingobium sp. SG919]NMN89863.1 flagellar basal body-associated protein FliL [Novosphingobium sp. SG916]